MTLPKRAAIFTSLSLACFVLASCDVGSFTVQLDRLFVRDANDRKGDEPAVALIQWQATFDSDNVEVVVHDDLDELADDLDDGRSVSLAGRLPSMQERSAGRVNVADMDAGRNPAIGGVFVIALDMDGARRITRNKAREHLAEAAACLEESLTEHVLNADWPDSSSSIPVRNLRAFRLAGALDAVSDDMATKCGEPVDDTRERRIARTASVFSLGLHWLGKKLFANAGGDIIGTAGAVFVGVDPAEFTQMEGVVRSLVGDRWPGCGSGGALAVCPISDRTITLAVQSDKGHYDVDLSARYEM